MDSYIENSYICIASSIGNGVAGALVRIGITILIYLAIQQKQLSGPTEDELDLYDWLFAQKAIVYDTIEMRIQLAIVDWLIAL